MNLVLLALVLLVSVQSYSVSGSSLIKRSYDLRTRTRTSSQSSSDGITCKDEDGKGVDWFIAYKISKLKSSSDENVRGGFGYAYLKPDVDSWVMSKRSINDSQSLVGLTTASIFDSKDDSFLYVIYNDQPPNIPYFPDDGHMKGLIIANENGGIWLQHTVPKFPDIRLSSYAYPSNGRPNAQIFFCMTLTPDQINSAVASTLRIGKAHVFQHHFPQSFQGLYRNLEKILPTRRNAVRNSKYPKNNQFYLSVGALNLIVFAKSPAVEEDIYSEWIAPTLKTNLDVQSWLNGEHPLNCTREDFSVLNIKDKRVSRSTFNNRNDHSKWAVGDEEWTCIADLNRSEHQLVRGGAAFCSLDKTLWKNFKDTIISTLPCPSPKRSNYVQKLG